MPQRFTIWFSNGVIADKTHDNMKRIFITQETASSSLIIS